MYPLMAMEERLVHGPPSLDIIIDLLRSDDDIEKFIELVRTYLPEHEMEILRGDTDHKITCFMNYFSQKYFRLSIPASWDGIYEQLCDEYSLGDFCYILPLELMGFSEEEYEYIPSNYDIGYIMMTALVVYPFYNEEGQRVPLLEECSSIAGKDIVEEIPERGWTNEQLHALTNGTRFNALADWADWICSETKSCQLNANYEWYEMEPWSEMLVQQLTEEYPELCRIRQAVENMNLWLCRSPSANFREIIEFLVDRQREIILAPYPDEVDKPKGQTLMEIFNEGEYE